VVKNLLDKKELVELGRVVEEPHSILVVGLLLALKRKTMICL